MLTKRLQMVYGLVPECGCAADVGTDHGYLLAELLATGKCARGIGSDLNPGPLAAAERTMAERGLTAELLLSDGLRELPVSEIDAVVIAGMGGELIAELVLREPGLRDPRKRIVAQPMTKAPYLRKALCAAGYGIEREDACHEGRRYYQATVFVWTGEPVTLTDGETLVGRLPVDTNEDARTLLDREREKLKRIEKLRNQ